MNMAEAGVGIGLGLKDFREVIVLNSRGKLNNFITSGWNVGTEQASAEAKYDKGCEWLPRSVRNRKGSIRR